MLTISKMNIILHLNSVRGKSLANIVFYNQSSESRERIYFPKYVWTVNCTMLIVILTANLP